MLSLDQGGSIEVRSNNGGIPYIDLSNYSSNDYDGRIYVSTDNRLNITSVSDVCIGNCGY